MKKLTLIILILLSLTSCDNTVEPQFIYEGFWENRIEFQGDNINRKDVIYNSLTIIGDSFAIWEWQITDGHPLYFGTLKNLSGRLYPKLEPMKGIINIEDDKMYITFEPIIYQKRNEDPESITLVMELTIYDNYLFFNMIDVLDEYMNIYDKDLWKDITAKAGPLMNIYLSK